MKKKLIIKSFILLQFVSIYAIAQSSDYDLHNKYWYYKARFNNDFVSVGLNAGQSLPFNQRGFIDSYTYSVPSYTLKTGDCSAQLGIYVAVLATEYRLLKDNGEHTDKVKHELFCALNAINRIDYNAEKIIGDHPKNPYGTCSPNLNGFFVRDDIPEDFVKNHYLELNYYNDGVDMNGNPLDNDDTDKGFTQLNSKGQLITNSGNQAFTNKVTGDWNTKILHTYEESQDQLYYLLLGTTMVAKLVDAGDTDGNNIFGYGSGETSLKQEAINISDRLIKYVKNSNGGMWTIRNPANGNAFVDIGHSALGYQFALDNVGCFIKYNQDFPSYTLLTPVVQNPCNDYRNAMSTWPVGGTSWGTLVGVDGGPKVDMQGFYHITSAIANCTMETRSFLNTVVQAAINAIQAQISNWVAWLDDRIHDINSQIGNLPSWAQNLISNLLNIITQTISWVNTIIDGLNSLYSSLVQQLIGVVKQNTTQERLIFNHYFNSVEYNTCSGDPVAIHLGSKAYFGVFAHRVLHDQLPLPNWMQVAGGNPTAITYPILKNEMRNVLIQAPCEGNYNFYPNRPGPEWGNPNRLDRMDPTYRYNLTCQTGFLGEYHGLDYMLLHNLYYLALKKETNNATSINDQDDRFINLTFPNSQGFVKPNTKTKGAFEYITSNSTLNPNAAVDFRAGKVIKLIPGFTVKPGADFHAYINPYHCASTYGELNRVADGQTGDYMEDDQPKQKHVKNKYESTESLNDEQTQQIENLSNALQNKMDSLTKAIAPIMEGLASKILVFPNPNNGVFKIAFNLEKEDNINLLIIDVNGKEVYKHNFIVGEIEYPFDFSNLPKGIYMAIAKNSKGETYNQKITIN